MARAFGFRAAPEKAPKFRDLGESYDSPVEARRPKKFYPSVSLRQSIAGLSKVGQFKTVRIKVRVRSIELRENEKPRIDLEMRGIEE